MVEKGFEVSEVENKEENFSGGSDFRFHAFIVESFKVVIQVVDIGFFNVVIHFM